QDGPGRDFALQVEIVLHVVGCRAGPLGPTCGERELSQNIADKRNRIKSIVQDGLDPRIRIVESTDVVARHHRLVEDSESAADRGLMIGEGIVSEADPGIESTQGGIRGEGMLNLYDVFLGGEIRDGV